MRAFFQKPFFKSIVFAAISILLIVGVCYAAVQNFSGNKLVNVGGITIGNSSEWPANQIEFEQTPSVIGFHSGADSILMRGGSDMICLGWGNDELTFNTGDGALTFGGDWSQSTAATAGIAFTDSSDEIKVWSNTNVVVRSEGGDVIVDLGS